MEFLRSLKDLLKQENNSEFSDAFTRAHAREGNYLPRLHKKGRCKTDKQQTIEKIFWQLFWLKRVAVKQRNNSVLVL